MGTCLCRHLASRGSAARQLTTRLVFSPRMMAGAIAVVECMRLFSARCLVPWHGGIGCEEFQEIGEDELSQEDVMVIGEAACS